MHEKSGFPLRKFGLFSALPDVIDHKRHRVKRIHLQYPGWWLVMGIQVICSSFRNKAN